MVEGSSDTMPELEVSVPLAKFDTDEWDDFSEFQSSRDPNSNRNAVETERNDNECIDNMSDTTENFRDNFSASLEDLVNTFDEKITKCFHNYEDEVEKYAPVQVRTQEEIMNECQMWWTITGNFGSILPIDWNSTLTRQKYLPALNLNQKGTNLGSKENSELSTPRDDDEEEVAQDLDLHQLIISGQSDSEPVKSAEEVIREIDDIMQEETSSEDEGIENSCSISKSSSEPELQKLPPTLHREKLKELSVAQLNDAVMELEVVIRHYSETLISQLAHRDELEYEKELKNTFISLLLQVQNKRRNFNVERKKQKKPMGPHGTDPKYLTTVIPYDVGHGPPSIQTIQILIKILTAINEDSPTVPTLLTDYILKVLCPS